MDYLPSPALFPLTDNKSQRNDIFYTTLVNLAISAGAIALSGCSYCLEKRISTRDNLTRETLQNESITFEIYGSSNLAKSTREMLKLSRDLD